MEQLRASRAFRPDDLLSRPSLLAHTEQYRRVRELSRRLNGHADPIWKYNDKLAGVQLAASLGLRVPRLILGPVPLSELHELPEQDLVLKPLNGASARGVLPLRYRIGEGFTDLFEPAGGPRAWAEHRADLATVVAEGRISAEFIAEELVRPVAGDGLPSDWKLLCVGGSVVLAYGMTRYGREPGRARYRYFSPEWEDLGPIRTPHAVDPTIEPPRAGDELTRAAEALARALPAPFVRIDLFEGEAGPVFGEITPQPGPRLWFGHDLDVALGAAFDDAIARDWAR